MTIVADLVRMTEDERLDAIARTVDSGLGTVGFCVEANEPKKLERYLSKLAARGIVEIRRMDGPGAGVMTIEVAKRLAH